MKPTTENVLAYILKRHRSILSLHEKFSFAFSNEKKLRSILKELRLEGKIRYGRLPHKDRGMYLHCYVPEMPPEGIEIVGQMEKTVDKADSIRGKITVILAEWEGQIIEDVARADLAVDVCDKILWAMENSADD